MKLMKRILIFSFALLFGGLSAHAFSFFGLFGDDEEEEKPAAEAGGSEAEAKAGDDAGATTDSSASGESGLPGFSLDFAKNQLQTAFSNAAPEARTLLDKALSSFQEGNDLPFLKQLEKLKALDLSASQKAALGAVKNDLMAAVLQRNFTFEETRANDTVQDGVEALRSGDLEGVKEAASEIKEDVSLNKKQKSMLDMIVENAPSMLSGSVKSLLP